MGYNDEMLLLFFLHHPQEEEGNTLFSQLRKRKGENKERVEKPPPPKKKKTCKEDVHPFTIARTSTLICLQTNQLSDFLFNSVGGYEMVGMSLVCNTCVEAVPETMPLLQTSRTKM
jgi:hypothetical protein